MNPAFSVVFLTTLIGAGQGLFLALYAGELAARWGLTAMPDQRFFVLGSTLAVVLTALGLVASFFHLGRPERAWRAAAMWRTSWLSREVIALPAFIAATVAYGVAHRTGSTMTVTVGAMGFILCLTLFVCTGMVYACIKFLREWSTPLTVINFLVLGTASGLTLAAAFSAVAWPPLAVPYAIAAALVTSIGLVTRLATLGRNARLRPRSTLQSAIGVRHPRIVQISQGFMGGSFNTDEFFHGRSRAFMRALKWVFIAGAFVLPLLLLVVGQSAWLLATAFVVQYVGLIGERWFFLAEANHPQNLYYQAMS